MLDDLVSPSRSRMALIRRLPGRGRARTPLTRSSGSPLRRRRGAAFGGSAPLGAILRGLAAGMAGTAAMTAYERAVLEARGSEPSTVAGDVAKRLAQGVFQGQLSEQQIALAGGGMHFLYGTSWGAFYGATQATFHHSPALHGLAFGTFLWGLSLLGTPALNLAPPLPLSEHLVYGLGVAGAYAVLER